MEWLRVLGWVFDWVSRTVWYVHSLVSYKKVVHLPKQTDILNVIFYTEEHGEHERWIAWTLEHEIKHLPLNCFASLRYSNYLKYLPRNFDLSKVEHASSVIYHLYANNAKIFISLVKAVETKLVSRFLFLCFLSESKKSKLP